MILAQGARGPGFNSRSSPRHFPATTPAQKQPHEDIEAHHCGRNCAAARACDSSVVRAADCRSAGPCFKSGCAGVQGCRGAGSRERGAGSMVQQGAGCRVQGARCRGGGWRVQGAGCKVQGAGCRVQGAGCSLQGTGCRGPRSIPLGVAWIRSELLGEGAAREHSGRSGQRGADRDCSEPLGLFGGLLGFVRGRSGMLGTATPNGSRIEVFFLLENNCAPIASAAVRRSRGRRIPHFANLPLM